MRLRRALSGLVVLGLVQSTGGCASLVSGPQQRVTVTSAPSGARATVFRGTGRWQDLFENFEVVPQPDALASGVTPSEITLERRFDYLVRFEKEGYHPEEAALCRMKRGNLWVLGNLVYLPLMIVGAAVAALVDSRTGAGHQLADSVHGELAPVSQPARAQNLLCR